MVKMEKKHILKKHMETNYIKNAKHEEHEEGIDLSINGKEITIKGTSSDLIELADYILKIASSKEKRDHIHLEKNTLLVKKTEIEELIIEKIEGYHDRKN